MKITVHRLNKRGYLPIGIEAGNGRAIAQDCTYLLHFFFNSLADKDVENLAFGTPALPSEATQTSRVRQGQIDDANRTLDDVGL